MLKCTLYAMPRPEFELPSLHEKQADGTTVVRPPDMSVHNERSAVESFLQWQKISYTVSEDGREALKHSRGRCVPTLVMTDTDTGMEVLTAVGYFNIVEGAKRKGLVLI